MTLPRPPANFLTRLRLVSAVRGFFEHLPVQLGGFRVEVLDEGIDTALVALSAPVLMKPGSTRTTSIPHGANSWRNVSLAAAIADFEVARAPKKGIVRRSAIDPMNTMRPCACG